MTLSPLDDFPVHQTALPIAHPATGDPNHYDRYFFNGYDVDGGFYFGVAMGLYPNRGITDAHFSVLRDGLQRSVFASARASLDRGLQIQLVGPISIEIVEPLGANAVRVTSEEGITAELRWQPRTIAVEEPRQTLLNGTRVTLDSTRLTQWGTWSGWIEVDGERFDVDAATTRGTKDRSWGLRPVGDQPTTAPATGGGGVAFFWSPVHWDDRCTHVLLFERPDGSRTHQSAMSIDVLSEGSPLWGTDAPIRHALEPTYEVAWRPGTRRMQSATFRIPYGDGSVDELRYEPLLDFQMKGLGYFHPDWGHGRWHGEAAVGSDSWRTDELDLLDITNIHTQQVCRVSMGGKQGTGVLEQLVIGPHAPTGLKDLLDGADT